VMTGEDEDLLIEVVLHGRESARHGSVCQLGFYECLVVLLLAVDDIEQSQVVVAIANNVA